MKPRDFNASKDFLVIYDGNTIGHMRADFRRAESKIMISDGQGGWTTTAFQVGDFGHCEHDAAREIFGEDVADPDAIEVS